MTDVAPGALRASPGEAGEGGTVETGGERRGDRPALAREGTSPGGVEGVPEIVVLDYGGQYSQLIARRIRDCGVFSELLPHHVSLEEIARRRPRGIVLSGGPASVYAPGAPRLERGLLELGGPV